MIDRSVSAALLQIYDAAVNPGSWRRALDAVASATDAKAIALVIRGKDVRPRELTMLSSAYLSFSRTPAGLYYGVWLSRLQKADWDFLAHQTPHEATPDVATGQSARSLDQRADYAFLRRRVAVGRRLGVRLNSDKVWFDAISLGFDASQPRVPADAAGRLAPILPHITKAVELGRTFAQLKARYRAVLDALDHVQVGLAVALPTGELLVENAELRRIFDLNDGLCKDRQGQLSTAEADTARSIRHHCATAAATAVGQAQQAEASAVIQRPSGRAGFLVDVAPLRDTQAELDASMDGALITVIDPEHVTPLKIERFAKLYGLSRAEAEVCRLIAEGISVADIAEKRGTTSITAKNQVAAVLSKTQTRRRAELVRLIVRVLPPVL